MTVRDLIEHLQGFHPDMVVFVEIRCNEGFDGTMRGLEEWREEGIVGVRRERHMVLVELDEPEIDYDEDDDVSDDEE